MRHPQSEMHGLFQAYRVHITTYALATPATTRALLRQKPWLTCVSLSLPVYRSFDRIFRLLYCQKGLTTKAVTRSSNGWVTTPPPVPATHLYASSLNSALRVRHSTCANDHMTTRLAGGFMEEGFIKPRFFPSSCSSNIANYRAHI